MDHRDYYGADRNFSEAWGDTYTIVSKRLMPSKPPKRTSTLDKHQSRLNTLRQNHTALRQNHTTLKRQFWLSWHKHKDYLHSLSMRWTSGDQPTAEDALSATACKASISFSAANGNIGNERAWFARILYNQCMDGHRRRKAENALSVELLAPSAEPSAEDDMLNSELRQVLDRLLKDLPPSLRGPVVSRLVDESPYAAIAKTYKVTEGNARKRVQHGRAILRRRLRKYLTAGEIVE
ncbi:RNA polymerase sigma factor (sigma-70 family) [Eilatimonas milleporae]|uniref:RNA polymerase sigma factor (Sigma-70 family) n=2 Tax=Eilatimonas milleporae TaxID=911205 RepID=A0A3M0CV14_9PROT|nr:RNA polymerase sigma factor (sigma-70 family) [Eilatimonas milleporae]